MRRTITVGFALAAIFLVTAILISPDASDDVNGILHRHHSYFSSPLVTRQLHELITAMQSSAARFSAYLQLTEFLNRFRVRLC